MSGLGDPSLSGAQMTVAALVGLQYLPPLPYGRALLGLARRPGVTPTTGAGQGHVIRDLRPFGDSDDPRHIDAAASARIGSPQVRSFHDDREASLILIPDFRRSMLWGSQGRLRSLAAAEALMRLGWQAIAAGGAVGAATLSGARLDWTPPRPRPPSLARIAGQWAQTHADSLQDITPEGALDGLLADLDRHIPAGARVVVASGLDTPGPDVAQALRRLARKAETTLLVIEDPLERRPPPGPVPCLTPEGARLCDLTSLPHDRRRRLDALMAPQLRILRIGSDLALHEEVRG